ncbi:MAG TPA: hypothetical protein VIA81_01850 [Acidimicrobiia bacterium]
MRRLLKTIVFLSGMAALVWAMRERFISITAPREEKPPAFRVPNGVPPNGAVTGTKLDARD